MTTTRTLMGSSYPMPGLHSKYYDQDMEPLVEVVQDTCGRHDAFALACAAKYYDDIGYPGHVNCSDNFNGALADKGVNARAGWMAINFFFNTAIDANGLVVSDEPWSRPGDYVLLRALTDIVCVSSACPDDTTPANGWNLTDIHVRTYSGAEKFSRAIARRMTPDAEPTMTRETAFHASFAKHTRNFVEYKGFWLANSFAKAGPIEEYWACREKAVVMDLSPLRKFEVTGPDSEALLQYALTRDVKKLGVGQVVYSAMCYEHGGMIDDGTLLRLGRDNFRWIGGDDFGGVWLREQAEKLGLKVLVRSSTDQMHNIAVQGPKSRDILKEIIWTSPLQPSIGELEWFRFAVARIGDAQGVPVVVSRTGYTGELGYEIFCHPRDAEKVFDAVWEAGQPHGLKPMGLAALDMVRIEAGLIFAGNEFSDQTDPFEAGIGFTVPLKTKPDDFIGRDGADPAQGEPVAQAGRAGDRRQCRCRPWRLRPYRPAADRRRHLVDALAAARQEHRAGAASTSRIRRSAPKSRSASSTATRSGCRRRSWPSRTTIRRRPSRAPENQRRCRTIYLKRPSLRELMHLLEACLQHLLLGQAAVGDHQQPPARLQPRDRLIIVLPMPAPRPGLVEGRVHDDQTVSALDFLTTRSSARRNRIGGIRQKGDLSCSLKGLVVGFVQVDRFQSLCPFRRPRQHILTGAEIGRHALRSRQAFGQQPRAGVYSSCENMRGGGETAVDQHGFVGRTQRI